MRHRVAGKKFGRTTSHKLAMLRNLVTDLILHDRIETTLPRAKELRRWADGMITLAKKNTVDARRQAMRVLRHRDALQKLFTTLVDRYKDRAGGYTRILKLGYRHGDNAAMAIIEFLTAEIKKVAPGKKESEGAAKKPQHSKKAGVAKTKVTKKPMPKSAPKKFDGAAKAGIAKMQKGAASRGGKRGKAE